MSSAGTRVAQIVGDTAARALFPVHSPLQQPIVPTDSPGLRLRKGMLPVPGMPDSGGAFDNGGRQISR